MRPINVLGVTFIKLGFLGGRCKGKGAQRLAETWGGAATGFIGLNQTKFTSLFGNVTAYTIVSSYPVAGNLNGGTSARTMFGTMETPPIM